MAFFTANIGLRVWDLETDDFSRSELANNWTALDIHDHTTGRGVQVPTGGIANGAVTNPKIGDGAVGTSKLADSSVTGVKLAANSVASAHVVDLAVITTKLADAAVTTPKLTDASVTTSKLADGSVTTPKLADNSVATAKVQNVSITEPKLAVDAVSTRTIVNYNVTEVKLATPAVNTNNIYPEAVTSAKLATGVVPVGQVIQWWRPSDLTPIPSGWLLCEGQSVAAVDHDFAEGTPIVLPDLRNRFILGAATSGTGTTPGDTPAERQTGGSNTQDTAHTHAIAAHSHTVNSHTHSIAANVHRHFFFDEPNGAGNMTDGRQRGGAVYGDLSIARRQAFYVPNLNFLQEYGEDVSAPMNNYSHDHGGTGASSPGTSSVALTTDATGDAATDNRPRYIGLLYLIKVKN